MSTAHVICGRQPVAEALRSGRTLHELLLAAGSDLGGLDEQATAAGVASRRVDRAELDRVAEGVAHQGVVARAAPFAYTPVASLFGAELLVALDGVTDPHNLGAVARSAEAAGAGGLLLPRRRSAHVTAAAEKAAAGALSWLPVAVVPNLVRTLADLAQAGLWSVGLDSEARVDLWGCELLDERVVIVVGAEGRGLSRLVRERVDELVAVPLAGHVRSLNASVAAATTLFEVRRRRVCASRPPVD